MKYIRVDKNIPMTTKRISGSPAADLQPGEIVRLAADNSTRMRVLRIDGTMVQCEWTTSEGKVRKHRFNPLSLTR